MACPLVPQLTLTRILEVFNTSMAYSSYSYICRSNIFAPRKANSTDILKMLSSDFDHFLYFAFKKDSSLENSSDDIDSVKRVKFLF